MRIATLVFSLLLVPVALGQPCDPAQTDELCADTTDWHRYLPLEVGNQWQYHVDRAVETDYDFGFEVTGETEIDGAQYYLVRYCRQGSFGSEFMCHDPEPVRYDEESRSVVRRQQTEDGGVTYTPYIVPFCPLDAAFGSELEAECGGYVDVYGEYGAGMVIGEEVAGDTRKTFDDGLQGYGSVVAGVGYTGYTNIDTEEEEGLIYARLGEAEYGTPAFTFPTPTEPGAAPPVATAFTQTYPNPARGTLRAQYTLGAPQAVTLELIDLLGRRVRAAEVGPQPAGTHDVRLDLGGLRAGVYVLRFRGDAGAEAARRVVVVQ